MAEYDGDQLPRHPIIGWGSEDYQRRCVLPEVELGVRVVLDMDAEGDLAWTDGAMRTAVVMQRAHEAVVGSLHRRIAQLESRWAA